MQKVNKPQEVLFKKRKQILACFFRLGLINAEMTNGEKFGVVNDFIKKHTKFNKIVWHLSEAELEKLRRQLWIIEANYKKNKKKAGVNVSC